MIRTFFKVTWDITKIAGKMAMFTGKVTLRTAVVVAEIAEAVSESSSVRIASTRSQTGTGLRYERWEDMEPVSGEK